MLSEKEFERLQKLACIKLSPQEKKKLGDQLVNIIDFLDQLNDIKINLPDSKATDKVEMVDFSNPLRVISGVREYAWVESLLGNVKHNKSNNNIVIKSVLN